MSRRKLLMAFGLVASAGFGFWLTAADSSGQAVPLRSTGDLKEQLKSKLRPRTPAEMAFVDRVVKMVEQDQLPLRTVHVTFNWARKKRRFYRFPYFQRALIIEAAKLGIRVQ